MKAATNRHDVDEKFADVEVVHHFVCKSTAAVIAGGGREK